MPIYLLFPLVGSVLYTCAILFMKQASELGVGVVRSAFIANVFTGFVFLFIIPLGGEMQPISEWWKPALVALTFLGGQVFTLLSLKYGDVSVATPILGAKILMVAGLTLLISNEPVTPALWIAAILASSAIVLLNRTKQAGSNSKMGFTIVSSLVGGFSFALFDVLIMVWAPEWGAGRFLPTLFIFVTAFSLAFIPFFSAPLSQIPSEARRPILAGSALLGFQAIAVIVGISLYGEATAMNVVYALRGLWSVVLVWTIGHWFNNTERTFGKRVFLWRLSGAVLLTIAIIVVLLDPN